MKSNATNSKKASKVNVMGQDVEVYQHSKAADD